MSAAAYGGKGSKERARVSGERPIGTARCRQQHNRASYEPPPPAPLSGYTIGQSRCPTPPSCPAVVQDQNGVDDRFPWLFDGRAWFRPALVRVAPAAVPGDAAPLALFGWTVGGVVCLEYDASPVGPYREYVTMGALVAKRGTAGQWGSRLFVSSREAEEVCQRVWEVPAELADIDFREDGARLRVDAPPPRDRGAAAGADGPAAAIAVSGWAATRSAGAGAERRGAVPLLWTPSIKALWLPFVPLPPAPDAAELPLNRLRLSASSLRLHACGQEAGDALGIPLPIGLSVDGLRIEISRAQPTGL